MFEGKAKYGHASPPKGMSGKELMRRINDGDFVKAPAESVERIKREIAENCEELIETGARIRPLLVGDAQVGWVRGIHPQERKMFKRWVKNPDDFVLNVLLLATTFSKQEIEGMTAVELRSLAEVVRLMGEYDMALYPYLSAYVTTASSEGLWFGKGERLTSYENRVVTMPDGMGMRIMAPPDHARLWASLCVYREQAKRRLDESMNSLFIVRPWAGKNADPIAQELRGVARQLETDSSDPWEKVIKAVPKVDVNDGWAHAGDSVEDLRRELKGMLEGDKHERLMEVWQKQMQDEAEGRQKEIEDLRKKRGTTEPGVVEERFEVLTDAQVRQRQRDMLQGKPLHQPGREAFEEDPTDRHMKKIQKYR
jgi:hypothetical protein